MFRCITRKKVDTQIYSKTFMFIPLAYQREPLNIIKGSIEGFKRIFLRLKIIRIIDNLVMVVLRLVDIFKGMKPEGYRVPESA